MLRSVLLNLMSLIVIYERSDILLSLFVWTGHKNGGGVFCWGVGGSEGSRVLWEYWGAHYECVEEVLPDHLWEDIEENHRKTLDTRNCNYPDRKTLPWVIGKISASINTHFLLINPLITLPFLQDQRPTSHNLNLIHRQKNQIQLNIQRPTRWVH